MPNKIHKSRRHDGSYKQMTSTRSVLNEDEVIQLMETIGFKILKAEDYSFFDKIILLSKISVIGECFGPGQRNSFLTLSKPLVIAIGLPFDTAVHDICDCMQQELVCIPNNNAMNPSQVKDDVKSANQIADLPLVMEVIISTFAGG